MSAWIAAAALAVAGAAAADAGRHRAAAEQAERLGRWGEAALEYAAAFAEDPAPELLYRLGLARRRLREYTAARDAFRAYLRTAPAGALKDEAERQLAQLDVLLDEEARHGRKGPAAPRKPRAGKRAAPPAEPAPPPAAPAAPPAEPPPPFEPRLTTVPRPAASEVPAALAAPTAPTRFAFAPVAPSLPFALSTTSLAQDAALEQPASRSAVPWIAAGAAAALIGGGVLWWDGARISRDLDARFASGDLAAADGPRYGRAHGESIAGRILVGAALCAGAAAVWLWR